MNYASVWALAAFLITSVLCLLAGLPEALTIAPGLIAAVTAAAVWQAGRASQGDELTRLRSRIASLQWQVVEKDTAIESLNARIHVCQRSDRDLRSRVDSPAAEGDEQARVIENHLNLVFKHEIDPLRESQTSTSATTLNQTHAGNDTLVRC